MKTIENLITSWDGESVVSSYDRPTGTWIFIALHSTALGAASGGTRMRTYPSPADGLHDAMRLAEGMTCKWAALDLPVGGGKAVLAVPGPLEGDARRGLLLRYGTLVDSLCGAFGTGEDLGTTPPDMAVIAERTSHVHGARDDGSVTDPGPFTARGVFKGLEAAVHDGIGRELEGLRVLVQGTGDVGEPLCRLLVDAGAHLMVTDLDEERARRISEELGAEVVDPAEAYDTPCDVYAPCAVGATLNAETIPRLQCRVVAGSANNQLAEATEDAARLHDRNIVYAPDYVINGGGALAFASHTAGERDHDVLMGMMDSVGPRIGAIVREAKERGESPATTSRRWVEERIRAARRV